MIVVDYYYRIDKKVKNKNGSRQNVVRMVVVNDNLVVKKGCLQNGNLKNRIKNGY
jgi:hypothetical protein